MARNRGFGRGSRDRVPRVPPVATGRHPRRKAVVAPPSVGRTWRGPAPGASRARREPPLTKSGTQILIASTRKASIALELCRSPSLRSPTRQDPRVSGRSRPCFRPRTRRNRLRRGALVSSGRRVRVFSRKYCPCEACRGDDLARHQPTCAACWPMPRYPRVPLALRPRWTVFFFRNVLLSGHRNA